MGSIFHPRANFNSIYEITPGYLKNKGILCVLLDIDNTLVPYSVKHPDKRVVEWLTDLKNSGLKIVILSNAREERAMGFSEGIPRDIAEDIGIITIGEAGKPLSRGFRRAEKELGIDRSRMCIIGDQVFTDIWGGNRNGVFSILVTPINNDESLFMKSKRILEKLFMKSYIRGYKNKGGEKTRRLGVIGYPIGHSVSPQIHNAICEVTGYNFYYDKFEVDPEELKEKFRDMRESGFIGMNVTIPHKENIMPLMDEISPEAEAAGAVNTVVFENGKARGYNTDIAGVLKAVEEQGETLEGAKVLIIGAGGAAKGAAKACMIGGAAKMDFLNRTVKNAESMAELFGGGILTAEEGDFKEKFKEYDFIINTTPAGMRPLEDKMPVEAEFSFREGQICFDTIYSPPKTLFLKKAEAEGAKIINGSGMLFWQAAEAFDKWAEAQGCTALSEEQTSKVRKIIEERGVLKW